MEKTFESVDALLEFAMQREQNAVDFYTGLSGRMDKPWMKQIFDEFAREEMRHKQKLQAIKDGRLLVPAERKVMDLKIGDYLVAVDVNDEDLDYQKALVVAMKREKSSYRLYMDLSEATDDENLKKMLRTLAQEEANHKLRFELEYDNVVLSEN